METRPLGDTDHESSVPTFGAIALDPLDGPTRTSWSGRSSIAA
jgi:hypothetical protein